MLAVIHHNSDWSGDAFIKWGRPAINTDRPWRATTVTVPGDILKMLIASSVESAAESLRDALAALGDK